MALSHNTYHRVTWGLTAVGLLWFLSAFFLAKRSLPHTSTCDEACALLSDSLGLDAAECSKLLRKQLIAPIHTSPRNGCWMDRRVHSMVYVVVDALRFDFALYDLPRSLGQRLSSKKGQLFQFIADPPTVTMQRLKALTTGGLPTFAEFSANMGGASLDEDSWLRLLRTTPWADRGLTQPSQTAFVGDDTWVDLFPQDFTTALPYPSFNTRDLDTVDNGCLQHIPELMSHLRGISTNATLAYEMLIVHFLGVDHVGHTYGPHNIHMDAKLRQMDTALAEILDRLDASDECHITMIMGDHGMTPDGNHGGGTEEEINAALFVHTSPACGLGQAHNWHLEDVRRSDLVQEEFRQINQIDLVPTIAILLGIPIPYANLGSLVPSLLPSISTAQAASGLLLNAAQVWRYFTVYSSTANPLPHLNDLKVDLDAAVNAFRVALRVDDEEEEEDLYLQAATLLKAFLHKALALGQRVWTRFDVLGMSIGIFILLVGLTMQIKPLLFIVDLVPNLRNTRSEDVMSALLLIFLCGVLTFSNSYILEEEHIYMYAVAILSTMIALRIRSEPVQATIWRGVLLIPVASRMEGLLVTGHGMDPSLRDHTVHHPAIFLTSTSIVVAWRWWLHRAQITPSRLQSVLDCACLVGLVASWWEKRQGAGRNGHLACQISIALWVMGVLGHLTDVIRYRLQNFAWNAETDVMEWTTKIMIAIAAVTGPSSAPTIILASFQMVVIYLLSRWDSSMRVSSVTLATLWRFLVRHVFFSTDHACTLNRLQLSAAFIATDEFNFAIGGVSLFINTFGWEIVGLLFAYQCSRHTGRSSLWGIYGALQILEALTSCISVSVLRRHLMVWDIYAPHFLFASIFTLLCCAANLTTGVLTPKKESLHNS